MKKSRATSVNAHDLLLEAIDSGALPPGARLRETELAARFGISRTPVREALKRLEAQGLVSHEPHHGAVVARLDYDQMSELYVLREVLEGTAARLAAQHATPTEIEVLRDMAERDHALTDDPPALARSNKAFHRQLHLSAHNRFLNQALESMRMSLVLLGGTTLAVPHRGTQSVAEHTEIVDAIARHDADAAEIAARRHISNAFKTRIILDRED